MMNFCVLALDEYDCSWRLVVTSNDSVKAYCPLSPIPNTHTVGCTDFSTKRIILLRGEMSDVGYDGMIILWHEIKHARLYEECMRQDFVTHFKCATYADWHG